MVDIHTLPLITHLFSEKYRFYYLYFDCLRRHTLQGSIAGYSTGLKWLEVPPGEFPRLSYTFMGHMYTLFLITHLFFRKIQILLPASRLFVQAHVIGQYCWLYHLIEVAASASW